MSDTKRPTAPSRPPPTAKAAASTDTTTRQQQVLRRFRIVFNAVKTHFRQVEKSAGIGGAQLWALSVIRDTPGIGMNDLAQAMDIHQSTASNLVKSLIEQGMVSTSKDSRDRRAVVLHLLPEGAAALARAPQPFSGVLPAALACLDARTLARLDKDLATLVAALQADEGAANKPLGQ
ncbi:MAG: MarR family winged helix-turn-helix transcriptional regulator [Acidobacteriota bacterium]